LLNNTGGAPLNQMTQSIRGVLKGKTYDLPKKSVAYDVLAVIQNEGIKAGEARYKQIKKDDMYDLNEDEMNQIGYKLMGSDKIEDALQVFKWNIDAFPESSNPYDSYGEASMKLGKNEQAIENYKKSVELNPGNQNGIDMLKKLGVDTTNLIDEVVISNEILESYVGKYELSPGFILTITKDGSQMKAQATGQNMVDIFPKSDSVFYLKVVQARIEFNRTPEGNVESLTLFQGGQEMKGMKMAE